MLPIDSFKKLNNSIKGIAYSFPSTANLGLLLQINLLLTGKGPVFFP
jgi:hypothetical protein